MAAPAATAPAPGPVAPADRVRRRPQAATVETVQRGRTPAAAAAVPARPAARAATLVRTLAGSVRRRLARRAVPGTAVCSPAGGPAEAAAAAAARTVPSSPR